MSVLERCPSYRESNKRSKERQEPTLTVRLTVRLIELSVKRESTVYGFIEEQNSVKVERIINCF